LAILGHELDNVLNGLLGINRLLLDSGLNPEQERWSQAIEHAGRQMRRLVSAYRNGEQVRTRGTAPVGGEPLHRGAGCARQPLDGVELLEQAVICQVPLAARRGNRLVLTVDAGVPQDWRGDICRLRQLLDNLLGNANKFTEHGEVVLRATRDGATTGLRLTVTDTGPGVDSAAAARIFDAREQGREPAGRSHGGSGLGLYICRRAVEAMGGTIRLAPPSGGGARFEVCVPGLLPDRGSPGIAPSSLLLRLEAALDVGGPLLDSLTAWLDRLGVRRDVAAPAGPSTRSESLRIRISELPPENHKPGPLLLLTPLDADRPGDHACRLHGPVVGATLGPVLLRMVLEWLWFRDDSRDSAP
jgi:anti-sigma regulatory factor (Ser/Thr protein kinase)